MDIAQLQSALVVAGFGPLNIDGDFGPKTLGAVDRFLSAHKNMLANSAYRSTAHKIVAAEQVLLAKAGLEVGKADGFVGPQTLYARAQWAALTVTGKPAPAWRAPLMAPRLEDKKLAAAVWPVQSDVTKYFGKVGENQTMLTLPYKMRLDWDLVTSVNQTSCHEKVARPAGRVLERVLDYYGPQKISALGLDRFGGCLNVRKMRGGTAWSMHAWGIAWDFWPSQNQLSWGRDRAVFARPEYARWWALWAEEGFVSLGLARNFDWMHVQAARL